MAFADLTTLDKLLKNQYLDRLRGQFYKQTPVFSRVKTVTEKHNFAGRSLIIGAHTLRSEAVGARAELATLPTASNQGIANPTVTMRYIYGSIKISGQTIAASRISAGAFKDALKLEMDGIKESLMFDTARQVVNGDGTGVLALVNGGATSTAMVVDNPGVDHIRKGMVLDVWTATTGGSQEVNSIAVSAVTKSTQTVTLASSQTFGDNSYVFREDARGQEFMGLKGIVDDGTYAATFQGITRSSDPWFNANVLKASGVNRPLTLQLVDDACLEAEKNGGGGYPTALYSKHAICQAYANLVRQDRRYSPKEMVLDGGWKAVEVTHPGGTCPWIMDRMVQANSVLAVNENDLGWAEMKPLGWIEEFMGAPALRAALDGTDAYEGKLSLYANLFATRCNGSTLLGDISES